MNRNKFEEILIKQVSELNITLKNQQIEKLYIYMNELIEWNEKMNLTAIVEPEEIIKKHFVDSLTVLKYIRDKDNLIDIGTGAGFPGIPLKIFEKNNNMTLLDSLNKRIVFLDNIIEKLNLKNIDAIHSRAEDIANIKEYRESYDIAFSRAVANLSVLLEYMIPFLKKGGICVCMKGPNIEQEIKDCKNALKELKCEIINIEEFFLPESDIKRNNIIIKKLENTDKKYPRKAGVPSKSPL